DHVKVPSQVFDPHPVFMHFSPGFPVVVKFEAELMSLIGTIRQYYSFPPNSVHDFLMKARNGGPAADRLLSLHALIPRQHLLQFDDAVKISIVDEIQFTEEVSKHQLKLFSINVYFHSTISVFYRPIMVLTCCRSCRPIYLNDEQQGIILNATSRCIDAAWRVSSLVRFFVRMESGEGKNRVPENERELYTIAGSSLAIFEAFIVLWFVACRMDTQWVTLASLQGFNNELLRDRLRYLLEVKKRMGMKSQNAPIVKAMEVMLEEVELIAVGGGLVGSLENDSQETIELGIRSLKLYTEDSKAVIDPWCYMGFLGLEIGHGRNLLWKGRKE
ncbi:hypothetical protein HDU99_003728, partial [Rhizoclosmatium hyalinum]